MTATSLLRPYTLGSQHLPNRLVMAPMTRTRAAADGVPSALMATYYAQRASAGLIIAEATTPNPVGQTYPHIPAIHAPPHVEGWRQATDAVRVAGGRMFLQLQHGGRIGHPLTTGLTPRAPSAIPLPDTISTADGPLPADGGQSEGERLLSAGADLISLGRAFLANPDLVARIRLGAPLNPVRETHFMYVGGPTGYTDYPVLGAADDILARAS